MSIVAGSGGVVLFFYIFCIKCVILVGILQYSMLLLKGLSYLCPCSTLNGFDSVLPYGGYLFVSCRVVVVIGHMNRTISL